MTASKATAAERIEAAHNRLLKALQPTEDMPEKVIDVIVRHRGDVQGTALACLLGRLMCAARLGKPTSPNQLAAIVEGVLADGEKDVARYAAIYTPKETDR
jgi:hypothetical protein